VWTTAGLHRYLRLHPKDQLIVVAGAGALCLAHLLVRLVPYRVWARALSPSSRHRSLAHISPHSIGRAVTRAARVIPRSRCLVQAIAAQLLLRLAGQRSYVRIGVAKPLNGELRAHAWVTLPDGSIVVGVLPDLDDFVPFSDATVLLRNR
jgi:hypothetical protein